MAKRYTTYERQRAVAQLVQERTSATVDELAEAFHVSTGTIRNDLKALNDDRSLVRVRGGAVARDGIDLRRLREERNSTNIGAKRRIARWAAEQVRDSDVIFLDGSTTVGHMVPYLQDRRNLTVVTSNLTAARALASDPSKTVILSGGVVRPDGASVTGAMGGELFKAVHIRVAFVSCTAFSLEAGPMEADVNEVQLKQHVVASSTQTVVLADASKFAAAGVLPFTAIDRVHHVVTDEALEGEILTRLRGSGITVTIAGANSTHSLLPLRESERRWRIGFANLSEEIPFAVDVRHSIQRAAKDRQNIDLVIADNALDGDTALQVARSLAEEEIDLLIEYQIDAEANNRIIHGFQERGIPVIALDIPMVGATYFGTDNYRAGRVAGIALAKWIQRHWKGKLDYIFVLEERRAGPLPAARIQGQRAGLEEELPAAKNAHATVLDSGNTTEVSRAEVLRALGELPGDGKLAVISFNADAALGARHAVGELGWDGNAAIVGQGADRLLRDELRTGKSPIIGSSDFRVDNYGEGILRLALKILNHEAVPPAVYVEPIFVTSENVDDYYPNEAAPTI